MLSIIKTAIITIIISFISGVLLDNYKNFAPRIVCSLGKCIPMRVNNRRIKAYVLTVKNISNKTIHNLNLNIQGGHSNSNLKIDDAKITKGLKFDISDENNIFNVTIPFLSKNDEFSAKVYTENLEGVSAKPIVALRSPEKFKEIDSVKQNGFFSTLLNLPENISRIFTGEPEKNDTGISASNRKSHNRKKNFFSNKKAILTTIVVMVLVYAGILGGEYYSNLAGKADGTEEKSSTVQQSNDTNNTLNKDNDSSVKTQPSTKSSSNTGTSSNTTGKSTAASNNKNTKAVSNDESTNSSSTNSAKKSNIENTDNTDKNKPSEKSTSGSQENQKNETTNKNTQAAATDKSTETKAAEESKTTPSHTPSAGSQSNESTASPKASETSGGPSGN